MFIILAFQQDPIGSVLSPRVIRQLHRFASFSLSYSIFSSQTHSQMLIDCYASLPCHIIALVHVHAHFCRLAT
jgi:hypothetical protein